MIDGPQSVVFQQAANRMHVTEGAVGVAVGGEKLRYSGPEKTERKGHATFLVTPGAYVYHGRIKELRSLFAPCEIMQRRKAMDVTSGRKVAPMTPRLNWPQTPRNGSETSLHGGDQIRRGFSVFVNAIAPRS